MKKRNTIALQNRAAMQDANQGRYDKALDKLSEATRLAKELEAPLLVAVSKNNMGIACQMAERPDDARTCFNLALQTVAALKPADHPLRKIIARNLANLDATSLHEAA